jgi:ABC-type Fe3+-siderophore transport system permease subunit
MEKLRTPLMVNAIYLILLGLSTLTPSLTQTVFGYASKDPGVLLVLSGVFFGFGVVVWTISGNTQQYGGLASAQVAALIIGVVFLAWGWATNLYTVRNALVPLIINIGLAVWIWSARPKS